MKADKTRVVLEGVNFFGGFKDSALFSSIVEELAELERLAEIGRATEMAFGFSECDDYLAQANKSHKGEFNITGEVFGSVYELLEWAKEVSNE